MSTTVHVSPLLDEHRLHLTIPNTLDGIPAALSALIRFCGQLRMDQDETDAVTLALDEAVSNVIRHGDAPEGIDLEIAMIGNQLVLDLLDDGPAFDPTSLPAPDLVSPLEERKAGGLGIHFIRTLMDHTTYSRENDCNRLRMIKTLRDKPVPTPASTEERLAGTDIFSFLGRQVSTRILAKAQRRRLADGEILFRQGDPGDSAYVLVEGILDVIVDIGVGEACAASLGRDEVIGELAVISGLPRSATVIARGDATLLHLDGADLVALLDEDPQAARAIISELGRRLALVNEPLAFLSVAAQALRREHFDSEQMDAMAAKAATLGMFGSTLEGLLRQIRDNQVRRQEMAVAKNIQESVLPKSLPMGAALPVRLHAFMRPAREVGGDLYDYFLIDETHLAVVIADVSGKGVPASLFMMRCSTVLRSLATSGISVEDCVSRANVALGTDNDLCIFVTLFFAVLDLSSGRLTYCNAGHNPPYVLSADGTMRGLDLTGPATAIIDDAEYGTGEVTLEKGDMLFLYTDGITEAVSATGGLFTEERLEALLAEIHTRPPADVVAAVVAAVDSFAAGIDQYDDITCLALTR